MSYSNKTYQIHVFLRLIIICFMFFRNDHKVHGLTDEQLREVEKLRTELNDAFEREEEINLEQGGVIIQPGWTQSGKSEPKINSKVIVTNEGLQETKRLRDEISKAIRDDIYVASVAHSTAGDTQRLQQLHQTLSLKGRSKDALDIMLSSTQNLSQTKDEEAEKVGAALVDLDDDDVAVDEPNIVNANAEYDIDIGKLQRLEFSKRRTKEMLALKSIEEDYSFNLGDDVLAWAFIQHDGEDYFIGRREQDLLIVRQEDLKYEKGHVLEIGYPITYLETYSYWNLAQQKQEGVIIIASRDNVLWYRVNNETHQIELYWEWSTGRAISGLTHFKIDSNDYLAVSSNESSRSGYYALNIYQFDLHAQEFWITQRLQLQFSCEEVTLLDTGRDIVLTVAQNGTAAIYTFNPRATSTDQIRFQLLTNIASEGIEYITAFKMGGRSYLALGGMQPQILLYQQGHFTPKTIFGQNFGLVELFFPIPVRTYRDDLILLIQHRVDFGTHKLTELEALIWNGESFETSIPVPCHLGSHIFYGVNCMLDIQRDAGLKGAALLKRGDEFNVIVPRHNAESGLFRFHTELLSRNSEVKDLQEIFTFLQDWVKEQDELIAQAQAFLQQPASTVQAQQMPDLSDLELLKAPELDFTGNIGDIYVNDYHWTEEDTAMDLDVLMESIEELGVELLNGRFKRDISDAGNYNTDSLSFDEVEIEELLVDMVNNVKFYIQNGVLDFDGILNLHSLKVLEHFELNSNMEDMEIDGNLEFEQINGISWETLKQGLVFRNNLIKLEELAVQGDVIVEDHLTINTLNSLKFPEDYLWSSGPVTSVVKAEKIFMGNLSANAIDTDGLINGVNPFDAITLSDPQDWSGKTTFTKLEVKEILDLNGTARGRGLDDFESNPTLLESHIISASCNFAQLEVQGPVHVSEKYESLKFPELLADIVQRPDSPSEEITILSKKSFATVTFPIDFRINDDKVNDIPIDQLVTVHTNQELNISTLEAYVYFNNLTIDDTYDGVNIDELLRNSIKIDEPTNASTTQLNMNQPITADKFDAHISLNEIPIAEGYQTLLEDLVVNQLDAENLVAKIGDMRCDIVGNGKFNGIHLREFLERRTWSEPSDTGNIFLDELTLENELVTESLHGINAEFLLNFLDKIDEIPEMILDGKIQVDHVIVTGDIQVHKLNGHNFDEDIQLTAIWLNRPNYLSTNLKFREPLIVQADLYCEGTLNGVDLPDLIDDMIFHNENKTLLIHAPKNFLKNVIVTGGLKLDAINGLPFRRIATKRNAEHFNGTIRLNGNLYVGELESSGYLNDFPVSNLSGLVRYDRHLNAYVLVGEVTLPTLMQLHDLTVHGNLNNFSAVGQLFKNMVYKHQICKLKGSHTFTGRVSIDRGAYVRNLNGYNLLALLNNIVYTRETQPITIKSAVEFRGPVRAHDITVKDSINATNLSGCLLLAWLNDTLRVDWNENVTELLQFGIGALDGNSFFAGFWNDVNLSQIITLHTPQNLSSELSFSEVYLDGVMDVKGLINDVDLKMEHDNTLMKNHGNQHISTSLTMASCRVLGTLKTNVPVNGVKDLHQLALLNEPLELRSPLYFENVTVKNVHSRDLVSGINLDYWHKTALWLSKRPQQWITGNWSVRTLNVMTDFENDMAPPASEELMRLTRSEENFYEISQKLTKILKKREEQRVSFVKYLEEAYLLELKLQGNVEIRQIFQLAVNNTRYLLLNYGCNANLFSWNSTAQRFFAVTTFESGYIEQVIAVPNVDENPTLRIIINAAVATEFTCTIVGLNTWKIIGKATTLLDNFEHKVASIHQTPTRPHSYYALVNADESTVQELSIFDGTVKKLWTLPNEVKDNSRAYCFLPASGGHNTSVNLSNGQHLLLLLQTNSTTIARSARAFSEPFVLPLFKHGITKKLPRPTESILKPNVTAASSRKLTFADFKQVVERIIDDLNYRLNLEVNITQLSIPESDLYDEHLVQDFIAIMQELQQQKLFKSETFAAVDLVTLEIPANPAQVLAARTVQIVWPVIVEIEEIHSYLKDNETHTPHPVCSDITNSLGDLVKDVLALAYHSARNETADYTKTMSAVIERIREFQQTMDNLASELRTDMVGVPKEESLAAFLPNTTVNKTATVLNSVHNSSILIASGQNLPCRDNGEVISFQVGATSKPRILTAVTWRASKTTVAGQNDGIKLYTDFVKEVVFQTISATEPRSLAALRIHDETLLAFIEGCCAVRVLSYRGIQGFIEFIKFESSGQVQKIIGLSLPKNYLYQRYFFAISTKERVKFYEAIMAVH